MRIGASARAAVALALGAWLAASLSCAVPARAQPAVEAESVEPGEEASVGVEDAGTDPVVAADPPAEDPEDEADVGRRDDEGEDVVERLGDAIGTIGEVLGSEPRPDGRIRWDPTWPRYRFDELVVTLGFGLVIVLEEVLPTRGDPNWAVTTDFDRGTAALMGANSAVARDALEEISDGLAGALFVWPVLFDSLIYAGLGEGAWDVAWQLSLISLEVFAINHALTVMVRLLTRRERPLGRFCREEAGYDADPVCAEEPPATSFWSAHVSNAFAGAALVCMHHDVLDLFGDEGADIVACGTALAAAAATGIFRIVSDYEWVSDVLTGALVGSLTGILVPWLLHFQGGARPPLTGTEAPTITFMPMIAPDVLGISATGLL